MYHFYLVGITSRSTSSQYLNKSLILFFRSHTLRNSLPFDIRDIEDLLHFKSKITRCFSDQVSVDILNNSEDCNRCQFWIRNCRWSWIISQLNLWADFGWEMYEGALGAPFSLFFLCNSQSHEVQFSVVVGCLQLIQLYMILFNSIFL